jgi:NAD(P)-dependent dehydrogenase (short-subunit alcohol dehydrogenase family)
MSWDARIKTDFFVPHRLESHVAVVTGAASGIGRACAMRYAREGARVVIADVDEAGGHETLELVRAAGGTAIFTHCDVTREDDIQAALEAGISGFGFISLWHNNAFWSVFRNIVEQSLEEFDRTIQISLRGYWLGAKAAVTHIESRGGRGVILNTGSVQSYLGERAFSAYQVAKSGILGLTRSLALDHAPHIRCVAIAPGLVKTPVNAALPDDTLKRVLASIPMARGAEPEEIAGLCAYLASDEADYITGTTTVIDGGYLHAG